MNQGRPFARLLRWGLVVGALAGILLAGLLDAARLDGEQARLCRALLPALAPDGKLFVTAIEADAAANHGVRIDFLADGLERSVRCAFAGGALDEDRLRLVAVEADGRVLGEAQVFFLNRFWLGDPEALAEGEARLAGLGGGVPLVPFRIGTDAGYAAQQILNLLPVSSVYAFLAVAYALVYGLVNRINLAFGELAVAGSFVAVSVLGGAVGLLGPMGIRTTGWVIVAAAIAGLLHGGLAGRLVGGLVHAKLEAAGPRAFLIATIGLSIALSEALRLLVGSRDHWIQPLFNTPILIADGGFRVTVTTMQILETAVAGLVLYAVLTGMRRSRFGLAWRAVSDDPLMARFVGLDPRAIATATFALSGALAGLAGAIMTLHLGHASTGTGLIIGLKALAAAVLGGIGSLPGAAAGGLLLGAAETLWSAYLPTGNRDIAVLVLLSAAIVLKPNGLFGGNEQPRDPARRGF